MALTEWRQDLPMSKVKKGPSRKKMKMLTESIASLHHPSTSYIYGFLCLVYDGITTIPDIKEKMKKLFVSASMQLAVEDSDVETYLQVLRTNGLVTFDSSREEVFLTPKGREVAEAGVLENQHISYWMRKFLTERAVMLITSIFLLVLAFLKIGTGLRLNSQGMFTEGFENLTDLAKVVIIYLGLRYSRDKLASVGIVCLMLVTGASMVWSGVVALLNSPNAPVYPTIEAFSIAFVSILLNLALLFLKGLVGRISGNLSLMSDAKDSEMNVYISLGVIIGFIFAIFHIYFMDAVIGILIAVLILKEGVEMLNEIWNVKEDDGAMDLSEINLRADMIFNSRLTDFLLASIRGSRKTAEILVSDFEEGLALGRHYYGAFADYCNDKLGPEIATKTLAVLIEEDYVRPLEDEVLSLTLKGVHMFYRAKAREYKRRARMFRDRKNSNFGFSISCLVIMLIIILLAIFAGDINAWLAAL